MQKRAITADDYPWPAGIVVSDMPVRRIHTRSRRRNTSLVYSTLPLGMREVESSVEERFARVAQLDPGVSRLRAQPCWLRVVEDGRIRRRAPDFAAMYRSEPELHEVKQNAECWKLEVASELFAVRAEVERHPHWRYSVSLESDLLAEPLRSNTDLLWRYLRPDNQVDDELQQRVAEVLGDGACCGYVALERIARRGGHVTWQDLLTLIAGRHIDFDVDVSLSVEATLWNRHSGPPRKRTLPFGTVERATTPPITDDRPPAFMSLGLRESRP